MILDFEKAAVDASNSGGYRDPEFVAECIREEHVRYDTYGFLAALEAQAQQAVREERERIVRRLHDEAATGGVEWHKAANLIDGVGAS